MALNFFGIELKDWVAIVALLASVTLPSVIFLVGRIRGTRSEQFRISLEIWDRIAEQVDNIERWFRLDDYSRERERLDLRTPIKSLNVELKIFVHLIESGLIKDNDIRLLYKGFISLVLAKAFALNKRYSDTDYEKSYTRDIIDLIEKYYKLVGRTTEFKDLMEYSEKNY